MENIGFKKLCVFNSVRSIKRLTNDEGTQEALGCGYAEKTAVSVEENQERKEERGIQGKYCKWHIGLV